MATRKRTPQTAQPAKAEIADDFELAPPPSQGEKAIIKVKPSDGGFDIEIEDPEQLGALLFAAGVVVVTAIAGFAGFVFGQNDK